MTAVWIILAALLAVVLLGTVLFLIACRRGPVPDLTKPEVIAKWGRAEQTEEILAGVRLMQDAENIFLPSYDGLLLHGRLLQQAHGESEGTYITFGVRERHDVAAWAAYAAMHFGPAHPLILDGLSMGAATVLMASELALPASVRGIIADCGFSSPYAIMKSVLHWRCPWLVSGPLLALTGVFTRLFGGFGLREVSATEAVAHTKLPILFIHGTGDRFVPCSMSQAAYDACTGEKRLILVEGAGHGQSYLVDRPRVQAAVREFLTDYVLQEAST